MTDFQKKIDKRQPNSVTDRRLSLSLWFLIIYNMAKITQLAKKIFENLFIQVIFPWLTLTRPLRRKLRIRLVFDVSKVKESSFFKSDLTDPPQIIEAHLF